MTMPDRLTDGAQAVLGHIKGVDRGRASRSVLTAVLAIIIIVGMVSPVAATHSDLNLIEDFEEDLSDWTVTENTGTIERSNNTSINGTFSVMIDDVDGDASVITRSKNINNPSDIVFWVKPTTNASDTSVSTNPDASFRLRNATGTNLIRIAADGLGANDQWSIRENGTPTNLTAVTYDAWVKVEFRNISYTNQSYDVWINGTQQATGAEFADLDASAAKDIRFAEANASGRSYWDSVYVNLEEVDLELEVPTHMWHGGTADYRVFDTSGDGDIDVTSKATVTSGNTDVITVDSNTQQLESTNNLSVSTQVEITATYESRTVSKNVTVANLTRENTNLMQNSGDMTRALWGCIDHPEGDTCPDLQLTMRILLIALGVGVAVASWSTSWAGIGATTVVVIMGWFMGWVGDGMVLITVFTGLFVALNVAANIDYSVRK